MYYVYCGTYSLLLLTLLNRLDINGHKYSRLAPQLYEGLEVALADSPLAANAVCDKVAGIDPAADASLRDLENVGDVLDGEKSMRQVRFGGASGWHGYSFRDLVDEAVGLRPCGGEAGAFGSDAGREALDRSHSRAAWRASRRTRDNNAPPRRSLGAVRGVDRRALWVGCVILFLGWRRPRTAGARQKNTKTIRPRQVITK